MSATLDAWRNIATRDTGAEMLTMSRSTLRELFDEMDARAERAEADADRLALGVLACLTDGTLDEHGNPAVDLHCELAAAIDAHDEAKAQR